MAAISMKLLLEAGVHFGHQTNKWNPKMKPYIFGARNGIYIIDLQQTVVLFQKAYEFIISVAAEGGKVLFVGTKKQAQDAIVEEATRCGMPYVNQRWLGGMLTNFATIKKSIDRLNQLEAMFADDSVRVCTKREIQRLQKEKDRLVKLLGGIRSLNGLPEAVFIVDPNREEIAVKEARKLKIPIVAMVDTNCDPDLIDWVIPGNDDAIRAIKLFTARIADAVLEGRKLYEERLQATTDKLEEAEVKTPPPDQEEDVPDSVELEYDESEYDK